MESGRIEVTPRAREKLVSLGVGGDRFVRLQVVSGGCSGMSYQASVETESRWSDVVALEEDGIRIVTDQRSMLYLHGVRIDYEDDLVRAGFRVRNPNAAGSCGCGASFTPPENPPEAGGGFAP
jgi:iron-sulfur cluster assembly protein